MKILMAFDLKHKPPHSYIYSNHLPSQVKQSLLS
jgi:hypothetical protein